MTDPLLQLLDGLPSARLNPSRHDRIRARCHAALVRERRRETRPVRTGQRWPSIVAGLGVLYLGEVLHQVIAFYAELSLRIGV
jgi:hypothetical protein